MGGLNLESKLPEQLYSATVNETYVRQRNLTYETLENKA